MTADYRGTGSKNLSGQGQQLGHNRDGNNLGQIAKCLHRMAQWFCANRSHPFLITGAVMATAMSANVYFWIIPGQRRMVNAIKKARRRTAKGCLTHTNVSPGSPGHLGGRATVRDHHCCITRGAGTTTCSRVHRHRQATRC